MAPSAWAQPAGGATVPSNERLREALVEKFSNGLREQLGLTDRQVEALMPSIREMERSRAAARSDRQAAMRQMRELYRGGGSDAELQAVLDRYEEIQERQRLEQADAQARIDEELTVRQRIEFRMYTQRFRRQLERRLRAIDGPGDEAMPGVGQGRRRGAFRRFLEQRRQQRQNGGPQGGAGGPGGA